RQPRHLTGRAAERREHPEVHVLARIDLLLDLDHLEMEVDLIRIAVAVEITSEHDGIFVGARDRRQLRLERITLDRAAAAERFGEREAVELRQILQIARLMRGKSAAQKGSTHKQYCDCNTKHYHRPSP